jgi:hypothetical protein
MIHAPLDGERVGQTPFRGEKATCWEGGFRVPMVHDTHRRFNITVPQPPEWCAGKSTSWQSSAVFCSWNRSREAES